ncbi:hypothetical protein OEZ86_005245 [Tetradesmus obliquus]|nr:hypothetical protein OEZ86_005245 [Tetradesmus obliquus]
MAQTPPTGQAASLPPRRIPAGKQHQAGAVQRCSSKAPAQASPTAAVLDGEFLFYNMLQPPNRHAANPQASAAHKRIGIATQAELWFVIGGVLVTRSNPAYQV